VCESRSWDRLITNVECWRGFETWGSTPILFWFKGIDEGCALLQWKYSNSNGFVTHASSLVFVRRVCHTLAKISREYVNFWKPSATKFGIDVGADNMRCFVRGEKNAADSVLQ
jgi:hypothetical protein